MKDGLDSQIQRALDIVRVVGNEAVHTMDLKDDRQTAAKLFELVNLIAYDRITRPNTVEAHFSGLPSVGARRRRLIAGRRMLRGTWVECLVCQLSYLRQ